MTTYDDLAGVMTNGALADRLRTMADKPRVQAREEREAYLREAAARLDRQPATAPETAARELREVRRHLNRIQSEARAPKLDDDSVARIAALADVAISHWRDAARPLRVEY